MFVLLKGELTIRLDDEDVVLAPGQVYVVPRGRPHQPIAAPGTEAMLIEPSVTVNTGDTPSHLTTVSQPITN